MNEITETLNYNHRVIIDTCLYNTDAEPRAWLISKTKRISPNAICVVTCAQDTFNQHNDYIERDSDGNIIGMWADWFQTAVAPQNSYTEPTSLLTSVASKITMSGLPNQVKVGSSKTFTVEFYEEDQPIIWHEVGTWSFYIDGNELSDEELPNVLSITYPYDYKVRTQITSDDKYIGKILSVKYTCNEIVSSVDVEIIAL